MKLALFDLDGTLLDGDSDHAFCQFVLALGWADAEAFAQRNDAYYADYLAGCLDVHAYVEFATAPWRGRSAAEQAQASQRFMAEVVQPMLKPGARALVQRHREQGDRLALVTATNDFVTRPIAQALGIETLIATDLQRDAQGQVTGAIAGVPAFREGKVTRVRDWLAGDGLSLESFERSLFYSDSTNDLPLLERVSHPVATNPGPALERLAAQRGWPILRLFQHD